MNLNKLLFVLLLIPVLFFTNKQSVVKSHYEEPENEAFDALHFLSHSAAFPYADIPKDGYYKAWQQIQGMRAKSYKTSPKSWQNLGPVNIGGRTISIAIDPNDTSIIWLGSASGGLWKSTTSGETWNYIPTGFPVLGVASILIDPANTKIMYIGTGETYAYQNPTNGLINRTTRGSFGIGILKSTDGGQTWAKSLDWTYQNQTCVWDLKINPKNAATIIAATTEGVYVSNNAGLSWHLSLDKKMVTDLETDPTDTAIVYAGVGNLNVQPNEQGVYKSFNGGKSWNKLNLSIDGGGRVTISSFRQNPKIVLVHDAAIYSTSHLYLSEDGGNNWKTSAVKPNVSYQGWYSKGLLMKDNDSSHVIFGGVNPWQSFDFAQTFIEDQNAVHSDIHEIISNPKDPDKIYILTDGGLFRSDDFGGHYYECTNGYVTSQAYIGSVSVQDSNVMLTGLQDNYSISYNYNNIWRPVVGGDGSYNAINPNDDVLQYVSYQYLNVFKSNTTGSYFHQVISTPNDPTGYNPAAFLAPLVICQSKSDKMYAGGTSLQVSEDAGDSWQKIGNDPVDNGNSMLSIAVSYTNPDSLYFTTAPEFNGKVNIFRSEDGGKTVTSITQNLPNRFARRIVVNPKNSREVFVVFSGFGSGHIFHSIDAGGTWDDISKNLPDVPFHCLTIDPLNTNRIFAGCDLSMFVSEDKGKTWTLFEEGFPEAVMVFDIVFSPADSFLLAFTHGHGVYKYPLYDSKPVVTGIRITRSAENLQVYPNPAVSTVSIGNSKPGDQVVISDLSGRIVLRGQVNENGLIQIGTLKPAVYLLTLKSVKGSFTGRFLKSE